MSVTLDPTALADLLKPEGAWAVGRGAALTACRIEAGLSRADLARACILATPTIWRIEAGKTVPSDRLRVLIAHHLNADPAELWRLPTAAEVAEHARSTTRHDDQNGGGGC